MVFKMPKLVFKFQEMDPRQTSKDQMIPKVVSKMSFPYLNC